MQYRITRRVIGCKDFIPIEKEEFEAALLAHGSFFIALGIEEKFDLLCENYAEFENDLLQLSMRRMLFQDWTWGQFKADVSRVNRRLVNLLATGRIYRDQIDHDLCTLYGKDADPRRQLKMAFSHEYDTRLGYRVMEALRDYSQHRGMVLWGIGYESSLVPDNVDPRRLKCVCVPKTSVSELRADRKFKVSVLEELPEGEDKIDVRPLLREYMSGIANVHLKSRGNLEADVARWRERIEGVINTFRGRFGDKHAGLAIAEIDERGVWVRDANIFVEFIEEYDRLVKTHRSARDYNTLFVSSESP